LYPSTAAWAIIAILLGKFGANLARARKNESEAAESAPKQFSKSSLLAFQQVWILIEAVI